MLTVITILSVVAFITAVLVMIPAVNCPVIVPVLLVTIVLMGMQLPKS